MAERAQSTGSGSAGRRVSGGPALRPLCRVEHHEPEQPRRASSSREPARAVALSSVDPLGASPRPTGVGELDRVLSGGLAPGRSPSSTASRASASRRWRSRCCSVRRCWVRPRCSSPRGDPRRRARPAGRLGTVPAACSSSRHRSRRRARRHRGASALSGGPRLDPDPACGGSAGRREPGAGPGRGRAAGEAARSSGRPSWSSGTSRKRATRPGRAPWKHLVDTVLASRATGTTAPLRAAVKHRFGPTGELGLFEMTAAGLVTLADPERCSPRAPARGAGQRGHRPLGGQPPAPRRGPGTGGEANWWRWAHERIGRRRPAARLAAGGARMPGGHRARRSRRLRLGHRGLRASEPAADLAIASPSRRRGGDRVARVPARGG